MKKLPSQSTLCTLFKYDAKRGTLSRGGRRCGRKVSISNVDYWSSRIVWKIMTGRDASGVIVFVDDDPTNLRWKNLMELTHGQQRLRGRAHSTSSTGIRGVYKVGRGRYRAQVWWQGRKVHLGTHPSLRAATEARRAAKRRLMGG